MQKINLSKMQNQQQQGVPPHIDAIFKEYIGSRNIAIADLQVYIKTPVGVGEHSDIGEEVKRKLEAIDKYDSILQTIMNLYPHIDDSESEEQQGQNSQATGEPTDLYEDGRLVSKFKSKNQNSE